MKTLLRTLLVLLISLNVQAQFVSNELYVMLTPESAGEIIDSTGQVNRQRFNQHFKDLLPEENIDHIEVPFFLTNYKRLPNVLRLSLSNYTNIDLLRELLANHPSTEYAERIPANKNTFTPNDLGPNLNSYQYHLYLIEAKEAWDISKGDKKVKVAIIDNAMQTGHPDLANNLWVNSGEIADNGFDDDNNGYIDDINGYDVADKDGNPNPPNTNFSHGTHVGGISGATTDNNTGIASIGFNISLMAVKCTPNNSNPISVPYGYEGISYAANAGADVINCSWGSFFSGTTAQLVIEFAHSKGSIIVAAAGNDDTSTMQYPANYPGVVAVASTGISDKRSEFSNYGNWVDISAPGEFIRSSMPNNTYASMSGTSMATPLVAGLVALMKSHLYYVSNEQLLSCLLNTATSIDAKNPEFQGKLGKGRINAPAALNCIDSIKNLPPTANIQFDNTPVCPGGSIEFEGYSTVGFPTQVRWEFEGGVPSSANTSNTTVTYPNVGKFDVKLVLTNSKGISDSVIIIDAVDVSDKGIYTAYIFDFEAGLNTSGFSVVSADSAHTWKEQDVIKNGLTNKTIKIGAFGNSENGAINSLISPTLDFTQLGKGKFKFNYSGAYTSSAVQDSLVIRISDNGGASFDHLLFASRISQLMSTGGYKGTAFTPTLPSEWCEYNITYPCLEIPLNRFNRHAQIVLRFDHINKSGSNNFYIDNIVIEGNCAGALHQAPVAGYIQLNKQESCDSALIRFEDNSAAYPSNYTWYFPSGEPAVSNSVNPEVKYTGIGQFDVIQVVENVFGRDSVVHSKLVSVSAKPLMTAQSDKNNFCKGTTVNLTAAGAEKYRWLPFGDTSQNLSTAPAVSTVISVVGTVGDGCRDTAHIQINVLEGPFSRAIYKNADSLFVTDQSGVTYQWFHNSQVINNATERSIVPVKSGGYHLEITKTSTDCKYTTSSFDFIALNVKQPVEGQNIQLYPNPSTGIIHIKSASTITSVEVFGLLGNSLYEQKMESKEGKVDISSFSEGIYLIRTSGPEGSSLNKVVLTH